MPIHRRRHRHQLELELCALKPNTKTRSMTHVENTSRRPIQPSRVGMTPITTWVQSDSRRQLKTLAFETGMKMERLFAESLNLLFIKYGKPEVDIDGRQLGDVQLGDTVVHVQQQINGIVIAIDGDEAWVTTTIDGEVGRQTWPKENLLCIERIAGHA